MNILKLAKNLKEFTLDEISMLAEYDVQVDLDNLVKGEKLDFEGKIYKFISSSTIENKFNLNKPKTVNLKNTLFIDVCIEFLNEIENNKSPVTLKSYKSIVKSYFVQYFGRLKTNEITLEEIENFTNQEFIKRLSKRTLNNILTLLGSILKYANQSGYSKTNPYSGLKNTKDKKPYKIKILNDFEIKKLLKYSDPELKLFINLIISTGIKKQEILSLGFDDVELGTINIKNNHFDGKIIPSKFQRTIKASKRTLELIKWIKQNENLSPATINKRLKMKFAKVVELVGLGDFKIDNLRDTFCVNFLKIKKFKELAKQPGMPSTEGLIKKYGGLL